MSIVYDPLLSSISRYKFQQSTLHTDVKYLMQVHTYFIKLALLQGNI